MSCPYPVVNRNVYKYDDMKRAEHMAVRTTVGWYLWTHQIVEVAGPDAVAFLEHMLPKKIGTLAVTRDRYTTMLAEDGTIIDDLIVTRMDEDRFWLSTLFRREMFAWFDAHKGDLDVTWSDLTPQWEMYAIQGPKSAEMVNRLVETPVDDLKFFQMIPNKLDGLDVYVNRAGFTGEKVGFELYLPKAEAPNIEPRLRELGEELGGREVTEFQVMAWTLPCEAGMFYMRDLRHTNPFEVGLEKGIDWEKDFVGKEALERVRDEGAAREVVGFTVEEPDIHIKGRQMGNEGELVYDANGECVGRCMKITYSYVNEVNNGTIICRKGSLKPGDTAFMHGYEAKVCAPRFI